ncbi:TatA/E family protein of Tat protein translocase [Catenulispora sp. GP43]|uniref:twin-arginine translocase TatA/TatE family subunit n=1 Tax=Catenulispora sp. GP43 TaxID=3156263 RepID=UPI003512B04E
MLTAFEPWHLIVIGGIAVMLFGAKRLPDNARSLGQSLRIFRSEIDAGRTTPSETTAQGSDSVPVSEPHS